MNTIQLDTYVRLLPQLVLVIALAEKNGRYETACESGLVATAADVTNLANSVVAMVEEAGLAVKNITLYVVPDELVSRLIQIRRPATAEEGLT